MTPLTNMSKLHFLYVEDDPFSREVLRMILTIIAGIPESHVTIFEDSVHFMDRLKALPVRPDVILLDIHMQPDDGFSLLKLLRAEENYRSARVVALTASVMNEEIRQLRHSGFDGAISKPLGVTTFPDLLARIAQGEPIWYIG